MIAVCVAVIRALTTHGRDIVEKGGVWAEPRRWSEKGRGLTTPDTRESPIVSLSDPAATYDVATSG